MTRTSQDAVVAPFTRSTVPPIVRVEPLEYDDSDDFPDDGKTVDLKAPGLLIENSVLFREAATQASPDPDEASAAPVPPAQTRRRSARVNRTLSGHVKRRTVEYDSDWVGAFCFEFCGETMSKSTSRPKLSSEISIHEIQYNFS